MKNLIQQGRGPALYGPDAFAGINMKGICLVHDNNAESTLSEIKDGVGGWQFEEGRRPSAAFEAAPSPHVFTLLHAHAQGCIVTVLEESYATTRNGMPHATSSTWTLTLVRLPLRSRHVSRSGRRVNCKARQKTSHRYCVPMTT